MNALAPWLTYWASLLRLLNDASVRCHGRPRRRTEFKPDDGQVWNLQCSEWMFSAVNMQPPTDRDVQPILVLFYTLINEEHSNTSPNQRYRLTEPKIPGCHITTFVKPGIKIVLYNANLFTIGHCYLLVVCCGSRDSTGRSLRGRERVLEHTCTAQKLMIKKKLSCSMR